MNIYLAYISLNQIMSLNFYFTMPRNNWFPISYACFIQWISLFFIFQILRKANLIWNDSIRLFLLEILYNMWMEQGLLHCLIRNVRILSFTHKNRYTNILLIIIIISCCYFYLDSQPDIQLEACLINDSMKCFWFNIGSETKIALVF